MRPLVGIGSRYYGWSTVIVYRLLRCLLVDVLMSVSVSSDQQKLVIMLLSAIRTSADLLMPKASLMLSNMSFWLVVIFATNIVLCALLINAPSFHHWLPVIAPAPLA